MSLRSSQPAPGKANLSSLWFLFWIVVVVLKIKVKKYNIYIYTIYIYMIYDIYIYDIYGIYTRFFNMTSFGPTSDLLGAENVTSIWGIKRSL